MDIEKRLIDANEEIRKIQSVLDEHQNEKDTTAYQAFEAFITCLENATTVDAVEVVHGRWVMKETMIRSPLAKNAYCSVCLEETENAHNYCPNCGAKMDGDCADGSV